jgi:HrpA-like RNA helicase
VTAKVFVIDSGKHKEKTYDADKKLCLLLPSWVSKASATQRKGYPLPLPPTASHTAS